MATGVMDLGGIIKGYQKNRGRQAEMWGEGDEDDGASNLKQPKLEREGVCECQNEQFYLCLECQEKRLSRELCLQGRNLTSWMCQSVGPNLFPKQGSSSWTMAAPWAWGRVQPSWVCTTLDQFQLECIATACLNPSTNSKRGCIWKLFSRFQRQN